LEERVFKIQIRIKSNKYNLEYNEFWYFKFFLKNIDFYFKNNQNSNVLIKIPGTKKFDILNQSTFRRLKNQINNKVNNYIDLYDIKA
tara:strand:+ start:1455 stop:1715 length:261 start_codon:yes stop_codon:yes gene_type:complete